MGKKYRLIMLGMIIFNLILVGIVIGVAVVKASSDDGESTKSEVAITENELYIEPESEEITIAEIVDYEEGMLIQSEEIVSTETTNNVEDDFYYEPLSEDIKVKIRGCSYPADETDIQISYDDLAYLHVLHYDFDNQIQEGELICNQQIAQDLLEIFMELYANQYQIEKIRLIDEYGADDDLSMEDNNTSCFNYRTVAGKTKLSNHAYGLAIDINPRYNPYVALRNGVLVIGPENGADYIDRSQDIPHKIDENDLCYQLFIKHGFTWGGLWINSKDYQHFEKKVE